MNEPLKSNVLVEHNPNDLELTLGAIERARRANEVIRLRDGAEAVEYLCCKGKWELREKGNPAVISLDIKLPKLSGLAVQELGGFWAVLNELPLGSIRPLR